MVSINLTIHNKAHLLPKVLEGIIKNTTGKYELIVVLDGCTDNSESELLKFMHDKNWPTGHETIFCKVFYENNVFETRANNTAAKNSKGDYIIIIQDDQIITEYGWNERLLKPFKAFNDVFAVSGRGAHNFYFNRQSPFTDENFVSNEWSDLLPAKDHICLDNCPSTPSPSGRAGEGLPFYIRDSVYRGPLAINRADLEALNYFDETFTQDCDDHDLMYRMRAKLGKVVGFLPIGWHSKPEYGGTRDEAGQSKTWVKKLQQKNIRTVWQRHYNLINKPTVETRFLK